VPIDGGTQYHAARDSGRGVRLSIYVDAVVDAHGYPRPQLRREHWESLNGDWEFASDPDAAWQEPSDVAFSERILVPFAPETVSSGIGDRGFFKACWYRRRVFIEPPGPGERVILHFGAVDFAATVWVNGSVAARHVGGYTPFSADVSALLDRAGIQEIVVRAFDDPHDLEQPRGKQDWQLAPHGIWYPRTTGIWQSVWLERLGRHAITRLQWTPDVTRWEINCDAAVDGPARDDLRLHVHLRVVDRTLAEDEYGVVAGEVKRGIIFSDPGIDDHRNELLWSPQCPTLIQADVELRDAHGTVLDRVASYTAMRDVSVRGDRILLNGYPYAMRLVLDQGYWPQSGLTAPDDDALRKDVLLAKAMGFNGVRKHQKIEDPRFLYWADMEGLLVWEEMPSAYRFSARSVERLAAEWQAVIERDRSHPSVVAWVPFNESWGVPDLPAVASQRSYVQALYHLTKTLDPSRPVIGNDGWESTATDIVGIHDYAEEPAQLEERYGTTEALALLFGTHRPGGRTIAIDGHPHAGQPLMVTEFGGIALSASDPAVWGYASAADASELATRYAALCAPLRESPFLSGFCYTQFADTYQEANGLLFADRTPKVPLDQIELGTRGSRTPREEQIEREQRERWAQLARPRQDALP
jgi:hypothetical protein